MPSRRTVLGGVAVATSVLAGCSAVSDGVDGTHTFGNLSLPAEDATVAASDVVAWEPNDGYVEARGFVHELADSTAFVLETRYRVEAHDDDNHRGVRTTHESSASVTGFDSNARRVDDGDDTDPVFRLDVAETAGAVEWELERVKPTWTAKYRFATRIEGPRPEPGDRLFDADVAVTYDGSGLFESDRESGSRLTLEYGDGAAEEWEPRA